MAGESDFYSSGNWNFFCDLCGKKQKSNRSMLSWNGLRVCRHHKEVRNPQDFLRGVKDDQTVPWSRPEKEPETQIFYCTLQARNAIPGFGLPGCMTPGFINMAFLPSVEIWRGWIIQDTLGNDIFDTDGSPILEPNAPQPQVI